MKRIVALALLLALLLSLVACNIKNEQPAITSAPATQMLTASPTAEPTASQTELPTASPAETPPPKVLPEYPVIDGSSSTMNMHAAIRAALTDINL